MGCTGIFLVLFLLVHSTVNALIFFNDGGLYYNAIAHFLGTNYIIHVLEVGLFLFFILHIIQGFLVYAKNRAARPVGYQQNNASENSNWYRRSMMILGSIILLFLIIHLKDFWFPNRFIGIGEDTNGNEDLYTEMKLLFQGVFPVVLYLIGVFALAWHLLHGFESAFQTLGLNHKKYTSVIRVIGIAYSIIIPLLFASMPLAFHFGLLK